MDTFVKKNWRSEDEFSENERERLNAVLTEAGLEGRDVDKLRKTMLSSDEAVAARKEELLNIKQRRGMKPDQEELYDVKKRMGRVMHHSDFICLLRRAVRTLFAFPGAQNNRIGLYFVPLNASPKYITWCELGYMPEYEIDIPNEEGIPVGQRRGWRTVLMRAIMLSDAEGHPYRLISEPFAEKLFGNPTNGATASKYRQHLYEWRNASH